MPLTPQDVEAMPEVFRGPAGLIERLIDAAGKCARFDGDLGTNEVEDAARSALESAILSALSAAREDGEARYIERHGSCPHKQARMKAEAACANAVDAKNTALAAASATEAALRAEACEALGLMLGTYEAFVDAHGGGGLGIDHLDGCPEDDTCECPLYVLARKAEAAARAVLSSRSAPSQRAGKPADATGATPAGAPGEPIASASSPPASTGERGGDGRCEECFGAGVVQWADETEVRYPPCPKCQPVHAARPVAGAVSGQGGET